MAIRPSRSVTTASAGSRVSGSKEVTVALRFSADIGMLSSGQMIGHEEGIEAPALQRLGEALQMLEVEVGVGESAGIAPTAGVDADRAHEGAEPQLPGSAHGEVSPGGCVWDIDVGAAARVSTKLVFSAAKAALWFRVGD